MGESYSQHSFVSHSEVQCLNIVGYVVGWSLQAHLSHSETGLAKKKKIIITIAFLQPPSLKMVPWGNATDELYTVQVG